MPPDTMLSSKGNPGMAMMIVQPITARRQQTHAGTRINETAEKTQTQETDERFEDDNASTRQISMYETSSDLSSVDETLTSDTRDSTTGNNLSIGMYWRQARIRQTGSTTTDEWNLAPGQRDNVDWTDSQKEMQARVRMWHEDRDQLNSKDSQTTADSIDLWQTRSRKHAERSVKVQMDEHTRAVRRTLNGNGHEILDEIVVQDKSSKTTKVVLEEDQRLEIGAVCTNELASSFYVHVIF